MAEETPRKESIYSPRKVLQIIWSCLKPHRSFVSPRPLLTGAVAQDQGFLGIGFALLFEAQNDGTAPDEKPEDVAVRIGNPTSGTILRFGGSDYTHKGK